MARAVAIIPARGGSVRIPRKNIKLFYGKPLIAYSIQTALESGLFEKVVVSTDDEKIAAVAQSYGAEVPFLRPKELSDDFTGDFISIEGIIDSISQTSGPTLFPIVDGTGTLVLKGFFCKCQTNLEFFCTQIYTFIFVYK